VRKSGAKRPNEFLSVGDKKDLQRWQREATLCGAQGHQEEVEMMLEATLGTVPSYYNLQCGRTS
jgi:hypothetical protein